MDYYDLMKRREKQIKTGFQTLLDGYTLETVHAQKNYRHLRAQTPRKPENGVWDVYTAPYLVTVKSDTGPAWTLRGEEDVLAHVRDTSTIYDWAQNITNPGRAEVVWETDPEITRAWVHDALKEVLEGHALQTALTQADQAIPYDDTTPYIDMALRSTAFGDDTKTVSFDEDSYDYGAWEVYTRDWIQAFMVLQWVAQRAANLKGRR